jgi:beta-lactamase superfamily II metal-dependent hydrolase
MRKAVSLRRLCLVVVLSLCCVSAFAGELTIVHINVGQGASTLILGPADQSGKRVSVLVDAGELPGRHNSPDGGWVVARALKRYGVTALDYFVATHYDSDHIGGVLSGGGLGDCFMFGPDGVPGTLADDDGDGNVNWEKEGSKTYPDLDEFGEGAQCDDISVAEVIDIGSDGVKPDDRTNRNSQYSRYAAVVGKAEKHLVVSTGADLSKADITLGGTGDQKAEMICLAADGSVRGQASRVKPKESDNDRSFCFLVRYGGFDYLIGGDIGWGGQYAPVEQAVAKLIMPTEGQRKWEVDVLNVNHHGSGYSSHDDYLEAACPEVAVISAGSGNGHGHPSLGALQRLKDNGVSHIYLTEKGETTGQVPEDVAALCTIAWGDVVVTTDGAHYHVTPGDLELPVDE